jgi:hypothetical protein
VESAQYFLFIFLFFASSGLLAESMSHLEPYRTDACSAPAGLVADSWAECCVSHDFSYWVGGSSKDKQRADSQLINCLRSKGVAGKIAAKVFDLAPKRFSESHWGSRWHPPRPDRPLSETEWQQVKSYQGLFSLPNPIVENPSGSVCSKKLSEEIKHFTHLPTRQRLTCFDLVNPNPHSPANEELVYSPNCQGYFVIQKDSSPEEPEFIIGYGECANLLKHPHPTFTLQKKLPCLMARPRMNDFYELMRALRNQRN